MVAESEGEISYQWYFKAVGGAEWQVSGMPGAKTATISVQVLQRRLGQQYKCVLTDEQGESVETDVVTVVNADRSEILIEEQPADIRAKLGENGTATVTASSEAPLSYQWYFMSKNGTAWQPSGMEGSKTATITVPVTSARLGQKYKCVIRTNDGAEAETDVVEVKLPEPGVITIDAQPADIRAKLGEEGSATVEASAEAALSYQWYFKPVNSDEWKASGMTGSKTATITVPVTKARLGQQYKCVITAEDGATAETEVVVVKLPEPGEITIVSQPKDIVAAIGLNGSATVEASAEAALSYQWYFKSVNSDVWQTSGMTGSKTATITVPVTKARLGQMYKCVITTEEGGKAETVEIVIREAEHSEGPIEVPGDTEITFEEQPDEVYAAIGDYWSVTVYATANTELSYQWYFKSRNATEWKVSGMTGNKTPTITVPVTEARIGQQYMCLVTAPDGSSAVSQVFTIQEPPAEPEPNLTLSIVRNPDCYRVMEGQPVQLDVVAVAEESDWYGSFEYQWYRDGEPVAGGNTRELMFYRVKPEQAGEYYCVVSVGSNTVTSEISTVEVFMEENLLEETEYAG